MEAQQDAFAALKQSLSQVYLLKLPGFEKPCTLENDANDMAIGAVLSQEEQGQLLTVTC